MVGGDLRGWFVRGLPAHILLIRRAHLIGGHESEMPVGRPQDDLVVENGDKLGIKRCIAGIAGDDPIS